MNRWLALASGIFTAVAALVLFAVFTSTTYNGLQAEIMITATVVLLTIVAITGWMLYKAIRAQRSKVKTGKEALIGAKGITVTELNPRGEIRVLGEFWQATTVDNSHVSINQIVEVVSMEGMLLVVKNVDEKA